MMIEKLYHRMNQSGIEAQLTLLRQPSNENVRHGAAICFAIATLKKLSN